MQCYTAPNVQENTIISDHLESRFLRIVLRSALCVLGAGFVFGLTAATAFTASRTRATDTRNIPHPYYSRIHGLRQVQEQAAVEAEVQRSSAFRNSNFYDRVCERVERRFAGDGIAIDRINSRLEKRFGFTCDFFLGNDVTDVVVGQLTMEVDTTVARGDVHPRGVSNASMLPLIFRASCDAQVLVEGFTVEDRGIGSPNDILRVWLRSGNERLSVPKKLERSKYIDLSFRRPLLVPACEEVQVEVMADFAVDAVVGGRHTFYVLLASDISTSVPVSGEFPLAGEEFELSVLSTGTLNVTYEAITKDVEIQGNDRQVIGEFTVAADLLEDQTLYSVILKNSGTIQDGDVVGITLRKADSRANFTNFGSEMYDDRISLRFDPPYVVLAGKSVTFQVTGDVVDGLRRNIRIEIEEPSDLLGVGPSGFGESGKIFGSTVILNGSPSRVDVVP